MPAFVGGGMTVIIPSMPMFRARDHGTEWTSRRVGRQGRVKPGPSGSQNGASSLVSSSLGAKRTASGYAVGVSVYVVPVGEVHSKTPPLSCRTRHAVNCFIEWWR